MSTTSPNRKRALALSNILFALVIIAAGIVGYLYFFDNTFFNEGPTDPSCDDERNIFVCVVNALKDEDFDKVEPGRYSATANQLDQPGQVIEINGFNAFIFIYPEVDPAKAAANREADAADLDPETLVITSRVAERPLNEGQPVQIIEHGNFILVVVGASDADMQKIEHAIETLP